MPSSTKRIVTLAFLIGLSSWAFAADHRGPQSLSCRVFDLELQGSYSGGCANGLAEGKGTAEGTARYQGDFMAGQKHGKGVKSWPTGDRYEGDFLADRREGHGTYTWGAGTPWAGEQYSGGYRDDRRNGPGTYTWPDGERYSGEWRDDKLVGAPPRRMLARAQEERERLAAVSKPGLSVCRRMKVGSVVPDWITGRVVSIDAARAVIRIDDAGRFEHRIAGVPIVKGARLEDWAIMWTPCRP